MSLTTSFQLANDSELRLLLAFTAPPRAGRITAIDSGAYTVEIADGDNATVAAYALNGGVYSVGNVVYVLQAENAPDSGVIIGRRGTLAQLGVGTATPAASAILELASTAGALLLPRMTTAQRGALTGVDGMAVYDSTLGRVAHRRGGAWVMAAAEDSRNQFTAAQGLLVTKTNVASATATNLARIDRTVAGAAQTGHYLVTIETYGGPTSSVGTWIVGHAWSATTVTLLAQTLFGHSALALTATHSTANAQTTLTFTQTNGGAAANTVKLSVLPLAAYTDGRVTLTAL